MVAHSRARKRLLLGYDGSGKKRGLPRAGAKPALMITVSEEKAVDYQITARIATEAFGSKEVVFFRGADEMAFTRVALVQGQRSHWPPTTTTRKIGQITLLHQKLYLDGKPRP